MKTDRKIKTENRLPGSKKAGNGSRAAVAEPVPSNGKHLLGTYEHAPIGIVESSLDGMHMNVNEEFCRILGYEKAELMKGSTKDFTHEDDAPIDVRLHQQLVAGHIPFYRLEKRYLRKNGEYIWVELTRSLVRDAEGNPLYTIGVVLDISERKHVERVLRESVERLRLATEAAEMFLWEWDFQTQIYTLADNFVQVLGFSAGLLPKNDVETVLKVSPPEDVQTVSEAVKKAIESHSDLRSLQYRMINPADGQTVWLEANGKIVYDEHGNARRMFGVAQNITGRKAAEAWEQLSASNFRVAAEANAKFHTFFDQGSYFAGVMTLDGTLVEANRLSLEAGGFKREEIIGKKFWECGWWNPSPDLVEMIQAATREAAQGKLFRQESKYYVADGSERFVDLIIAPVKDETGQILFLATTGTDITERKRMEDTIRESEERFRALVSQATAGIAESDVESQLTFVNPRFCEMLGYSEEELLGKTIWELTYTDDLEENKRLFKAMITQGESYQFEKRFIRKDGSKLWTSVSVSTIRDLSGQPKGGVGVVIDIDERKQADETLKEFARQQEALYKLSDQLHRTDSLEDVFNAALEAIISAIQCDRASILLFDDRDVMRFVAWRGLSEHYRETTDGHSPWMPDAKDPEPIYMNDIRTAELDEHLRAVIQEEGIGSLAFIPLVSNGTLIGKFMVYYNAPHAFDKSEFDLSLTIAYQLASGIERKRAGEALERERELLERLFETMPVMVSIYDPATNLPKFNSHFEKLIGWKMQEVTLLSLMEACYPDPEYRKEVAQLMTASAKGEWIDVRMQTRHGRTLDTTWSNMRFSNGMNVGIGIDITERKQAENRLALLTEISELLRNVEDPYELMYTISKTVGEHLHVKRALFNEIDLANDREIVHRDYHHGVESVAGVHNVSDYSSITSAEVAAGRTVINMDAKTDPRTAADYEKTYALSGERSYVVVPLMRENRWVASLWVSDDLPRHWSQDEVSLLETVAERTWTVIEKLRINTSLRSSEQRFREIFETAGVSVWVEDFNEVQAAIDGLRAQGVQDFRTYFRENPDFVRHAIGLVDIIDVNLESLELFGARNKEDLLHSLNSVFIPESETVFVDELTALAEGREMLRAETSLRTLAGRLISVLLTVHFGPQTTDHSRVVVTLTDITARKYMEQALRESEQRYRFIVENTSDGIWWIELTEPMPITLPEEEQIEWYYNHAVIRQCNLGLARMYGYDSVEEVIGMPLRAVMPRANPLNMDLSRDFIRSGYRLVDSESREVASDGRELVFLNNMIGIIEDGKLTGEWGTNRDITERKRAEEALRASESLYRTIARSIPGGGVYVVDKDFRYLVADGSVTEAFGLSREMLEGHTVAEIFPGERGARLEERLRQNFAGETLNYENEHNGRFYWTQQAPLLGSIGQAIIVTLDITERKQAEQALLELNLQLEDRVLTRTAKLRAVNQTLREEITERQRVEDALRKSEAAAVASEEKLRTLFVLLPVGISFLDLEGRIIQMNSALVDILKLSKEQLLGNAYHARKYIRANGTLMPSSEFASVRALAEDTTIYNVETGVILENGEVVWTSVSAAPVAIADVGAVVVKVETTESRRAQQALQDSRERLRVLTQRLVEVQEDERRAIARELHDRVGQPLAALNINLIIINSQLSADSVQQIGARMSDSMKLVAETIALVRDVMSNLRPAVLDDYGLEAALQSHTVEFTSRYGINVMM